MTNSQAKSLETLSALTGIKVFQFKRALGQPLGVTCDAKTAKEARCVYYKTKYGSEEQEAALVRWNELSLQEVEQASSINELQIACQHAPCGTESYNLALSRWNELSLQEVEKAWSIHELLNAHDNAPSSSEAQTFAVSKMLELCATLDEALRVYEKTLGDKLPVIRKALELCVTVDEVRWIHDSTPIHGESRAVVLVRWNQLSLQEVDRAQNINELKKAFGNAPSRSEAEAVAFKRWIESCTTLGELKEVFDKVPSRSEAEVAALKKMCELYFGSEV